MLRQLFLTCLLAGGSAVAQEPLPLKPLTLEDGDTVALVGNTFVEREQRDGYIELALTLSAPDADVTFRNLGWSGDTVDGRARRFFGPTKDGMKHLLDHLDLVDPTVILVSYGTNEAFDGAAGRAAFLAGYGKLLDGITRSTKRVVLVTSPPLDPATSPAPEVAARTNAELRWQAQRLGELAKQRGLHYVDLFSALSRLQQPEQDQAALTDNGMHLSPRGYRAAARVLLAELGLATKVGEAEPPAEPPAALSQAREQLRLKIIEKNELFFHRHRPQNETYLRGFRKHEQGNNAVEIYAFDPLVVEKDREVFALRAAAVRD